MCSRRLRRKACETEQRNVERCLVVKGRVLRRGESCRKPGWGCLVDALETAKK